MAAFMVGQDEAEMNLRGVMYIRRNMIKMDQPVSIIGGRTMISADALSTILGMEERVDSDTSMDLILPAGVGTEQTSPAGVSAQAVTVAETAVPDDLKLWAGGLTSTAGASYQVAQTGDSVFIGIAGGSKPTGGYTIAITSITQQADDTWVVNAEVVAPTGFVPQMVTNPVGFFQLVGVTGAVQVHFNN
jgi:hypothetical protein